MLLKGWIMNQQHQHHLELFRNTAPQASQTCWITFCIVKRAFNLFGMLKFGKYHFKPVCVLILFTSKEKKISFVTYVKHSALDLCGLGYTSSELQFSFVKWIRGDHRISVVYPGSMVLVEIPTQQRFVAAVYCFYLKLPLGIYTFLALSALSCTQLLKPSLSQNVTYHYLYQNHWGHY